MCQSAAAAAGSILPTAQLSVVKQDPVAFDWAVAVGAPVHPRPEAQPERAPGCLQQATTTEEDAD